jgi:hypothetical protein
VLHCLGGASDHHAVAALETPGPATGPNIHVMDSLGSESLCPTDVVNVVGIAAIDQDVTRFEIGCNVSDGIVHECGRDHQPDGSRSFELLNKILERRRSDSLVFHQLFNRSGRPIEGDTIMTVVN